MADASDLPRIGRPRRPPLPRPRAPATSTAPAFEGLMNEADPRRRRSGPRCSTPRSGWAIRGAVRAAARPGAAGAGRRLPGPAARARGGRGEPAAAARRPASPTFLVDTGLGPERPDPAGRARRAGGGAAHEIVRLETARRGGARRRASGDFAGEVEERLRAARQAGAVGAKSIAAYRVGLDAAGRPSRRTTSCGGPLAGGRRRAAWPTRTVSGWLAPGPRSSSGCRCSSTSATATATSTCPTATRCG